MPMRSTGRVTAEGMTVPIWAKVAEMDPSQFDLEEDVIVELWFTAITYEGVPGIEIISKTVLVNPATGERMDSIEDDMTEEDEGDE